jgi:competence protein ComEA
VTETLDIDASRDGSLNGPARYERAVPINQEALMFRLGVFLILLAVLAAPPSRAAIATAAEAVKAATAPAEPKVNINTAGVKELMTLEGVGRGLAEKIVKYRDANGQFKKPTDLRKVEGLGDALWEKNRTRIVVK